MLYIMDSCADGHDRIFAGPDSFGTFTKQLRKVTGNLFMSGHPSVSMERFGSYQMNFLEISYWGL
jgi:hypothetical protein